MKSKNEIALLLYYIDEGLDIQTASVILKRNHKQIENEFLYLQEEGLIKLNKVSEKFYNAELTETGRRFLWKYYYLIKTGEGFIDN